MRRSVSVAVRRPAAAAEVLIVQRPEDDADLPNVWGLPAASLRPGESWEEAVRRAGLEKLGVDLAVGPEIRRGSLERRGYTLVMRLFEAAIAAGEPRVPQPHPEVTQYRDWRWGTGAALVPGADLGSLCCRLYLESDGRAGRV